MRGLSQVQRRFPLVQALPALGLMVTACGLTGMAASPANAASASSVASPAAHGVAASPPVCDAYIGNRYQQTTCPDDYLTSGSTAPGKSGDSGGSDAGGSPSSCHGELMTAAEIRSSHLPQAPTGEVWVQILCKELPLPIETVLVPVSLAGAPPKELALEARGELREPVLEPGTAPPRGKEGLVGLPEWFWVPAASWHPLHKTVRAGRVWATVTATPVGLRFDPGGGLASASCAGPGTAYDKNEPVGDQSTDCDYTYLQSSADQPGGVYKATLTVIWRISWIGSGGVDGVLEDALAVPAPFTIKVTQAEAVVTTP